MPLGRWPGVRSSKAAEWCIEGRTETCQAIRNRATKEKALAEAAALLLLRKKAQAIWEYDEEE